QNSREPCLHWQSGPVAKLVDKGTFNPKGTGSIPVRPITDIARTSLVVDGLPELERLAGSSRPFGARVCYDGPRRAMPSRSGGSLSSTKSTWVGVDPMFSPLCVCASSQRTRPDSNVTSRCSPSSATRRRSNPLKVTMTLSGWSCGFVCCPGSSLYSSTRTRSFSKTSLYLSGSVCVGSATICSFCRLRDHEPFAAPRPSSSIKRCGAVLNASQSRRSRAHAITWFAQCLVPPTYRASHGRALRGHDDLRGLAEA